MRKTLLFAAAPLLIAVSATGVSAQAQRDTRGNWSQQSWRMTPARNAQIRQDINSLRQAINTAASRRRISNREADRLRSEANSIQRLYASYARNGLSWNEVNALETRVNRVRVALRMERRDWDGRPG
jgi:uncharacterized protein YlxW (UPF0749 family)